MKRLTSSISREIKSKEYLETLWNIMMTIIDLGLGVDSVQMCLPKTFEKAGETSGGLIRARKRRSTDHEQGGTTDDR